jgi:Nucleoside-diphosphate-sugar epimerases
MSHIVLVTGAHGFVGRYTARQYKNMGYTVLGMGHGDWKSDELNCWGIDFWYECDITMDNLIAHVKDIEVIVHCAGSGSVGFSIENPMHDFERTVWTTHLVLEYIRKFSPNTKLIYPSSAAVYGNSKILPIKENSELKPISPYGVHKKIAEELCKLYAQQYKLNIIVLRLFSVYGNGLKKQLLWDACRKIKNGQNRFWGTGNESRDWIHIEDVAKIFYIAREKANEDCLIVNIAGGVSVTIKDVLGQLFDYLGVISRPVFGGEVNTGNPLHYLADINILSAWDWEKTIDLDFGIKEYVRWYKLYEKEKNSISLRS